MSDRESTGPDLIRSLLRYLGEDPSREGLAETDERAWAAWKHWTSGYAQDPISILKPFEDGARVDELVFVGAVPFFSVCEHHLAPFFGLAHIGYIPKKRIVGLSKIPRLLEVYARRLQTQERITEQVADTLMEHLSPIGVGVVLKARHMCLESRGIAKPGVITVTSAMRGALLDKPAARAEFFSLVNSAQQGTML